MKWMGSVLLLWCGLITRHALLEEYRRRLRLGEELCQGLEVLHQGVFYLRDPLPHLLHRCREKSNVSVSFWDGILSSMEAEESFETAWQRGCSLLPEPYASIWGDLKTVLSAGMQEEVLILTGEEIRRVLTEERRRQRERDRLVSALCLSLSVLAVVVLL